MSSENHSEKLLKSIKVAYAQQFDETLDERFLVHVVERELQRKKEAFLQIQLASFGLSLDEMASLRTLLSGSGGRSREHAAEGRGSGRDGGMRTGARAVMEAGAGDFGLTRETFGRAGAEEETEEMKRAKRRAYARAYYHKKKAERDDFEDSAPRKFKTTSEQRAYQRAYYQRKKTEKVPFESGTLAKVAAKALEAQKQALAKAAETSTGKKEKVDFNSLAADRVAIDNAFKVEAAPLSLPKTKLRKAVKTN